MLTNVLVLSSFLFVMLKSVPMTENLAPRIVARTLGELIQRQLDPDDDKVLLSFLSTKDRIQVAECSPPLSEYRHHLRQVAIVCPDTVTVSQSKALLRMFQAQVELEHLILDCNSVYRGLSLLSFGCGCKNLKTLDLSARKAGPMDFCLRLNDSHAQPLVEAISGGALSSLEALDLSGHGLTTLGLCVIVRAFVPPDGPVRDIIHPDGHLLIPCPKL